MSQFFKFLIILSLINISSSYSDIIKPSFNIKPGKVIKIQLQGLMKNDIPEIDRGIEQTWEFAHPNNRRFTGPLSRFKEMIKGDSYSMLINHISHKIEEIYTDEKNAVYEVLILDTSKNYFKFRWEVEKFLEAQKKVKNVIYPTNHQGEIRDRAKRYMKGGYGSLVGMDLGSKEAGAKFIDSLKLLYHVANIGDARSLAIHPASTTHSQLNEKQLAEAGVTPGYVRLSIGIEHPDDIISDIKQALAA